MKADVQSLPERVEYWARWFPDATALEDGRVCLNYATLNTRANKVAAALAAGGCGRGDFVVVEGKKNADLAATLIGVLKAGAAFVPIQLGAPAERVAAVLRKTGAQFFLRNAHARREVPGGITILDIDTIMASDDATCLTVNILAEDPAYVLFTSGSTGEPNGALISHQAMVAFFGAINCWLGVTVNSRYLNTSPFFFDTSILDVMLPIYFGARVYLTDDILLPQRLMAIIENEAITAIFAVGSTLALLSTAPGFRERHWPSVASVLTGAEVVSPRVVQDWLATCPNAEIFNAYGPTEATVATTIHHVDRSKSDVSEYPIGRPLPGVGVSIDRPGDAPTPGQEGELWLSGIQVLDRYVGDDALSTQKIVVRGSDRSYRTGDLVRLVEGEFRFLGRTDDTVKIRGYRVSLSDVSHQFRTLNGVINAVATRLVHQRHGEIVALALECPSGVGDAISYEQLQQIARDSLPKYMRPRLFAVLPSFPRKPSGKVDVAAVRAHLESDLANADEGLHKLKSCPQTRSTTDN